MWAMMPMFRVRSSGELRAMTVSRCVLPAVVGERLVRLRHSMGVFALLHALAALVGRVDDLVGQLLPHALAAARARVLLEPAHRQRRRALGAHLDGHLVGGAA